MSKSFENVLKVRSEVIKRERKIDRMILMIIIYSLRI
jgi:hypothetical protein